jgi:hypothetical protein
MFLKATIVSFFPPYTPHKARRNNLSDCIKLGPTPWRSPISKEVYHPSRHNPSQSCTAEECLPKYTYELIVEKKIVY